MQVNEKLEEKKISTIERKNRREERIEMLFIDFGVVFVASVWLLLRRNDGSRNGCRDSFRFPMNKNSFEFFRFSRR